MKRHRLYWLTCVLRGGWFAIASAHASNLAMHTERCRGRFALLTDERDPNSGFRLVLVRKT